MKRSWLATLVGAAVAVLAAAACACAEAFVVRETDEDGKPVADVGAALHS